MRSTTARSLTGSGGRRGSDVLSDARWAMLRIFGERGAAVNISRRRRRQPRVRQRRAAITSSIGPCRMVIGVAPAALR
jgi:hypothetical protein